MCSELKNQSESNEKSRMKTKFENTESTDTASQRSDFLTSTANQLELVLKRKENVHGLFGRSEVAQ